MDVLILFSNISWVRYIKIEYKDVNTVDVRQLNCAKHKALRQQFRFGTDGTDWIE